MGLQQSHIFLASFLIFYNLMQVNCHLSTHAGDEVVATITIKAHKHWDTLPHFSEVATSVVLGWQQRERTSRCLHNLLYMACIGCAVKGINLDIDLLPIGNIVDGVLIHIGHDVDIVQVRDLRHRQTCRDTLPLYRRHLYNRTRDWTGDIYGVALSVGPSSRDGKRPDGLSGCHLIALLDRKRSKLTVSGRTDIHNLPIDLSIISGVKRVTIVDVVTNATHNGEDNQHNQNWNENCTTHNSVSLSSVEVSFITLHTH